jgi:hypothetical protein
MVFLVRYKIFIYSLKSFVINFVSLPVYVKFASFSSFCLLSSLVRNYLCLINSFTFRWWNPLAFKR